MPWDDFASHFGTPDTRVWPGNDGFPAGDEPRPADLPEGTIIDRFGSDYGRYLAPLTALLSQIAHCRQNRWEEITTGTW